MPVPELYTNRLLLFPTTPDLAMVVSEYFFRNRSFFQPALPVLPADFFTPEAQRRRLERQVAAMRNGSELRWLAFHRTDKSFAYVLGDLCLTQLVLGDQQSAVVGYQVDERATRQGLATEMLRAAVEFAFGERRLHRLEAYILPDNEASRRTIEKMGFECEGIARKLLRINGCWTDHLRYVRINE
jgi:ribosomal-protein-alanine N-acetyltransferase